MAVSIDLKYLAPDVTREELEAIIPRTLSAQKTLAEKSGKGNDFLGWTAPEKLNSNPEIARIKRSAERLRETSDVVIVVGIGGSYLGARAAIEYLVSPMRNSLPGEKPQIWFLGNDISASHMAETLALCEGRSFSVIVVSKSGTTTEPAVAFRILKAELEKRYGAQAASHIVAITDAAKGALHTMAEKEGYETFVIPDDVGGRFSVLTPVGLLPIAVAGIDIEALLLGAADAAVECGKTDFWQNDCLKYAAARNILLEKGKSVELYASWDPCLTMTGEWLKQLYGESEGKQHKGLFPAAVTYTTDLHSMGQFVQDGSRIMFETVLSFEKDKTDIPVKKQENDLDGLNYLNGMTMCEMTSRAKEAVAMAHRAGGTPTIMVNTPARTPYEYGWLLYFFEYACGVSGYILGVNPFDQPGVEDYKKNMFALLGKPGYEELAAKLLQK